MMTQDGIRALLVGAIAAALVAAAGVASAQAPRELTREQLTEARALFEAGRAAFIEGRYEDALDYFDRSYEISGAPELLYNVGHAAERLRQDERALDAFEAYLREVPDAEERASIERRIALLREAIAEREAIARDAEPEQTDPPRPSEARAAPPAPEPPPSEPSPAGWVVAGIGGAGAVAGAILLGVGAARGDEVASAPEGTPWPQLRGAYEDAGTLPAIGGVLLGVGVAAMAAGVLWGVIELGSADAQLAIGPAEVVARGTF